MHATVGSSSGAASASSSSIAASIVSGGSSGSHHSRTCGLFRQATMQRVVAGLISHPPDGQVPVGRDDVIHPEQVSSHSRSRCGRDPAHTMPAMRVLVVEDEPEVAGSLARGLAEAGMSVDVALSGEEALETLRAGLPYDVAVLDVMLGGDLDGIGSVPPPARSRGRRRRSSCSPPATTSRTGSPGSTPAPTTTWPSRSTSRRCSPGSER